MDFRIELDGHHAEDSAQGFRGLCEEFVKGLHTQGYHVIGSTYNWDATDPAQGKPTEEPVWVAVDQPAPGDIIHNLPKGLRWHSSETVCPHCEPEPVGLSGSIVGTSLEGLAFGSVEPSDAVEVPSLAGIDFASDESAERAADLFLVAADFDGLKPSGKGGYTSRDVGKAAK